MWVVFLLFVLLLPLSVSVHAEYLGDLSENELNPHSIFNDLGAYGALSPTSPRNSIGLYGSAVSPYSATNPLAMDPPRLYDQEGNYRGKLSTNTLDPDSVSNPLGRYGSSLSPDSLKNPLGKQRGFNVGIPADQAASKPHPIFQRFIEGGENVQHFSEALGETFNFLLEDSNQVAVFIGQ